MRILLFLSLWTISFFVQAERISADYAGMSLSDAVADIAQLSDSVNINFIYDRLDEYPVTCRFVDATPLEALRKCIGFYPVTLRAVGNNIFVEALHDDMPRFSGQIVNMHNKPVEYASIRIYNATDSSFVTGGVSNADGHFAIPVMPREAFVRVTVPGMRTVEKTMIVEGTTTFRMETNPIVLRNVEVVHKSVYFTDNTMVSIPTKLEVQHSPDLYQLLMQQPIPGLYVDPLSQSLTIMNRQPVIVVDGIRRDVDYLRHLDPARVARIEYTTNVPQKYIEGSIPVGMLTIVMKERTNGGNIRANINQAVNSGFTMGGVTASYNQGKSELIVSYNLNRRDYNDIWEENRATLHGPDFVIDIDGTLRNTLKRMSHNLSLGWTLKASSKVALTVTVRDVISDNSITQNQKRHDSEQGNLTRYSSVRTKSHSPLFDIYLRYTPGDKDNIELQATTQIQNQEYDRVLCDTLADRKVESYPSQVGTHYNYARFSGSWTHDFASTVRFTLGENGYYARSRNTYRTIDTRYVNREFVNYLSARVDLQAGKVNMGAGAGLRYIDQRNEAKLRQIVRCQSNINLWVPIGKEYSFSFIASYFTGYPTLSAITEMTQDYDGYLITTGNASLKNPHIFNIQEQLNFNRGKFWAQLQLSQYIAQKLSYYKTEYAGNNRFVTRPMNMKNNFDLNNSFSIGARGLFGGLLTFNTTLSYRFVKSNGYNWSFCKHLFNYSANITAYYSRCSLTLMAARNSGVFAMWTSFDTPSNRLIFDWTPINGLNFQLGWWYILNRDGNTTHNYDPVYKRYSRNSINDNYQMVTLGVSWNFNFGRKSTGTRRNLGIYGGSADTNLVQ